ncbi:MAG TPA: T9SS type A sorting domain-containing protein [Rubricoccaceae bacterium]
MSPRPLCTLALVAAAALSAAAAAQTSPVWEELPDSPYNWYRSEDVVFVGPDRGWAVVGAGGGEAYRTVDGGATWSPPVVLNGYLRATGFATVDKGWIGVLWSPSKLYETLDGGLSYADVTSRIQPALPGNVGVCGMWVLDAQTAYAVGQYSSPAYLLKTTDGGASWSSRPMAPVADELIDVMFFDAQHGLATGGTGPFASSRARIIGTDDGGQTWTVRHTVEGVHSVGWKLTFPSRLVGYASVEQLDEGADVDSIVLKTVDGGQTWTQITIPGGGSLQGIGFVTPEVGWASGRGRTSVTTDGGLTWSHVPSTRNGTAENSPVVPGGQLDGDVNRFRFYDGVGYAAGHRLYRIDTGGFVAAEEAAAGTDGLDVLAPNPARGPVRVGYRVSVSGPVRVEVFDVQGRRVASLVDGEAGPGAHVATWVPDGLAPGLYVVRMRSGAGVWSRSVSVVGR